MILSLYDEWVEDILGQLLDRKDISYKTRTWYYPGTNSVRLPLRHRPVYPTTPPTKCNKLPFTALTVTIDEGGNFGQASGSFTDGALTYGTDYTIRIDQDDGGSREALLYRVGNVWPRPIMRSPGLLSPFIGDDTGSVQVISTAGFTIDTLPGSLRAAANLLVGRMSVIFPTTMQISSESYIERSISLTEDQKRYLLNLVRPIVLPYKNWKF